MSERKTSDARLALLRALARRSVVNLRSAGPALARNLLRGSPAPLSVTLAPTNRCQGRCAYCGIWKIRQDGEREVGWWLGLLGELRRAGTCRVGFTGGEPLLYDGIELLVARARELSMLVSIGSNGLLVPERRDVLRRLDYLVLSIDGPREINDRQRFPGAHEAANRAIAAARAEGVTVWVTSVITRQSVEEMPAILAWAAESGVRLNLQLPFHPVHYCGQDNAERFPEPAQIRAMLDLVRPHARPDGLIVNSPAYLDHVAAFSGLGAGIADDIGRRSVHPCQGGRLFFHVEPDGRVYPCCHQVGAFEAHEVDERGLGSALSSAGRRTCTTCLSSYAQEQSLLFDLRPRAVVSWARAVASVLRRPVGGD